MISRDKLSEKQKRVVVLLTAVAVVYLSFRFLLPIILPFLISLLIAVLCEPAVNWIHEKTRFPRTAAAFIILVIISALLILVGWILVKKLIDQAGNLINSLPEYEKMLNECLMKISGYGEKWLHIEKSKVFEEIWGFLTDGVNSIQERLMPWIIDHGPQLFSGFVGITTVFVLIQVAVVLCVKELDSIRAFEKSCIFKRELELIKRPVVRVGKAYLKTQIIIIVIVISELMFGLSIMGNKYSLILGLLIGILDALPLFGTGTVLIPWILVELLMGRFGKMVMVLLLYLTCYFTRQFLEPKLMGDGTGLSSLETLVAIYSGFKIFGIWGLFTGPIAWLLIKECVKAYS